MESEVLYWHSMMQSSHQYQRRGRVIADRCILRATYRRDSSSEVCTTR